MPFNFPPQITTAIGDPYTISTWLASLWKWGQRTIGIDGIGRKNLIINGNFDIWQRGATFTASATSRYTADRWRQVTSTTTLAVARTAFTVGQTTVPFEPEYYVTTTAVAGAGNGDYAQLVQRIEGVQTLAGQYATISFWAKADASCSLSVEYQQSFGSAGSAAVNSGTVPTPQMRRKFELTTGWKKYFWTTVLPSISGKTVDNSARDDYLEVIFWLDAGSTFNSRTDTLGHQSRVIDIAQVQVESSPFPTAFEKYQWANELDKCLRYYEKTFLYGTAPAANAGLAGACTWIQNVASGDVEEVYTEFKTVMRAAPSVTFYNPSLAANNNACRYTNGVNPTTAGGNNPTAVSTARLGDYGFTVEVQYSSGSVNNTVWSVHYTADAEL